MNNFIKTTDVDTAQKLMALGFKLVSQMGNVYTFLNEASHSLTFESVDKSKIAYDNKLSL